MSDAITMKLGPTGWAPSRTGDPFVLDYRLPGGLVSVRNEAHGIALTITDEQWQSRGKTAEVSSGMEGSKDQ